MTDCPRNFTRDQIISKLKAGHTLCVDRRDAPELEDLWELEDLGLVTSRLVVLDEQSSVLKFHWRDPLTLTQPARDSRARMAIARQLRFATARARQR